MLMFQTQPDPDKKAKRRKNKQNDRPDSSGMLYFILAFVVCLAIFAGIGVLWWKITDPALPFVDSGETTTTAVTTTVTRPANRFTVNHRSSVAVYITDDKGALQTVSLCLFKPDTDSVSVIPMPAELALPDAETDTLIRRFATGGVETAHMALSAYLGKSVDYFVVLSYDNVEKYFTALDSSLVVKLPKDVDQQTPGQGFSIHLQAGEQALTAKQAANLLRCDNWQNGRRERANMHAAMVSAYINQFFSTNRSLAADHADLLKVSYTNLNSDRFSVIEPSLSYLADLNKELLCTSTNIEGSFTGAGDTLRFTPEAGIVDTIKSNMK